MLQPDENMTSKECFAEQLKLALKKKHGEHWQNKDLLRDLVNLKNKNTNDFFRRGGNLPSEASITNWIKGVNYPQVPMLLCIAEVLDTTVDKLLCARNQYQEDVAEAIVKIDGFAYDNARREIILSAKNHLIIQVRAGGTLNQWDSIYSSLEVAMRENQIKVQLLIGDPNHEATISMIAARRGDKSAEGANQVAKDINGAISQVIQCARRAGSEERLSVRIVPHIIPNLVYITDPVSNDVSEGRVLALMANFGSVSIREAPMIFFRKFEDSSMFDFFYQDFLRFWEFGEKESPKVKIK